MSSFNLIELWNRTLKSIRARENTVIDRQRLSFLLICYIPITLLGILANLFGITEPTDDFFSYTHGIQIIGGSIIMYLYLKRKTSIRVCLSNYTDIGQLIISSEMIYSALQNTEYYKALILANMVLLTLNTMVSMAAYLKWNTIFLGITTILTYIACCIICEDEILQSFIMVFTLSYTFVGTVGVYVTGTSKRLENENKELRQGEAELLSILRVKKNDVKAYITLASDKYSDDDTRVLLNTLDKKSRHNLLTNVSNYIKARKTDLNIIERVFPDFTPSEREICRLILQDKKLGEISLILNKSISNINSQRANMRKKLELKSTDNLSEQLHMRLSAANEN